ncbi:MAG TPA: TRAP transporter small permease [Pseudolabrys sp.]|nr:TRAP transporter small permease [Pseudolabrys sp.]
MASSPSLTRPRSALTAVFDLCGSLSALLLGVIVVLVTADIATRSFHLANLAWVNEVTEYLLTFATFTGAPWVLHHHGHVNIDIIVTRLSASAQRALTLTCDAGGLIISAVLFYEALRVLLGSYADGSMVFKYLVFPEWYLTTPIVFCFALCTLEFAGRLLARREVLS